MIKNKLFFLIPVLFFLTYAPNAYATTFVEGDILDNTTWVAIESPYVVNTAISIAPDAKLTVEPGVVVKFDYGTSIYVSGLLDILGKQDNPVYLTSISDDSVGGDTNEDGDDSSPEEGDWVNIILNNSDGVSIIDNVVSRYAVDAFVLLGGAQVSSFGLEADQGLVIIGSNGDFSNAVFPSIEAYNGGSLFLTNSLVKSSGNNSLISVGQGSSLEMDKVTIKGNTSSVFVNIFENSTGVFNEVSIEGFSFGTAVDVFNNSTLVLDTGSISGVSSGLDIFNNSSADIKHVSLSCVRDGVTVFSDATVEIVDSEISCLNDGILFFSEATGLVDNAKVHNANDAGIIIFSNYDSSPVVIEKSEIYNNEYGLVVFNSSVSAQNNNIHDNVSAGALAFSPLEPNQFIFVNNYWGHPSGPQHLDNPAGLGDIVSDEISFAPWLTEDPLLECCSSVLFLPGLKGSVLRKEGDTLWPPTFLSNDVSQLALTADGESVNDVYVDGVLNTFHTREIYKPFSEFVEGLKTAGTIEDWYPMAYDWRFSPETIIADGIKTKDGVVDVLAKIEELASESKSGKVAIVAHSMGGLVGKEIIKKLKELGESDLIESFVMVGSPQLGTPQAIGSVLHGDGERILGSFIVNPIDIRQIAQNMPSAYNLLPSARYFEEVVDPVITFDKDSKFTKDWRDFWNLAVDTYDAFSDFITGEGVPRAHPGKIDLNLPEVMSSTFLADAGVWHDEYDDYVFPEDIRVVQVAGWGSPTIKALEYTTSHGELGYRPAFTREGDGTVVYPSAISSIADETYFFNLSLFNKDKSDDVQHRNLLSSSPVQEVVFNTLTESLIEANSYLSIAKPSITEIENRLIVSTHSPVLLGAYDQFGNFTGVDLNQDLSAEILDIKEDIPDSTFFYTSEGQYMFLPKDGVYNFIYQGIGEGPTTVLIDDFVGDISTNISSYADIPTTSNTSATFTVDALNLDTVEIALDNDGDGEVDEVIYPDNYEFTLEELLVLVREKINNLDVKSKVKKDLLKRLDKLEKKIEKKDNHKKKEKKESKKQKQITKKLSKFIKDINKKNKKGKILDDEAKKLVNLLEQIEAVI